RPVSRTCPTAVRRGRRLPSGAFLLPGEGIDVRSPCAGLVQPARNVPQDIAARYETSVGRKPARPQPERVALEAKAGMKGVDPGSVRDVGRGAEGIERHEMVHIGQAFLAEPFR